MLFSNLLKASAFCLVLFTTGCATNDSSSSFLVDTESFTPPDTIVRPITYDETDVGSTNNLKYGVPCRCDLLINRIGYANGYSFAKKQPYWVSYELTREKATTKACRRTNDFRPDPCVPDAITPADYRRTGYDRGHIAPAADMSWDRRAMHNSFYMSNMSPQVPMFNRGIWRLLEEWVRETAISNETIFVYTGPIFATNEVPKKIGYPARVEVPDAYYKVILAESEPRKMIGFILKNEPSDHPLSQFACTVDQVEEATGMDFFTKLTWDVQTNLESKVELDKWHLK